MTTVTGNHTLDIAILSWLVAQVLKGLIVLVTKRKFDFKRFLGTGGMPSSHTAFVVSLVASIGKTVGVASPAFAISACLALVVMQDAQGVRRSAGEQAKILNYMMDHWNQSTPEMFGRELKELLGHTPLEIVAGAVLGLLFGILL